MTWAVPKFGYGDRVQVTSCDNVRARVVDLHFFGMLGAVEYDVRYFHDGREMKIRVFEDELIEDPSNEARSHLIYKAGVKTP